jgi:hypothetical protein
VPFVDVVGANILNDKEVAHFVFGSPENESILSASLTFPQDAVMAFHRS